MPHNMRPGNFFRNIRWIKNLAKIEIWEWYLFMSKNHFSMTKKVCLEKFFWCAVNTGRYDFSLFAVFGRKWIGFFPLTFKKTFPLQPCGELYVHRIVEKDTSCIDSYCIYDRNGVALWSSYVQKRWSLQNLCQACKLVLTWKSHEYGSLNTVHHIVDPRASGQ